MRRPKCFGLCQNLDAGRIHSARADKIFGAPARRKPYGAEADVLYGVTMQEQGVTRILSINLGTVEEELNIR